jgi:hypothetical protein
VKKLYLPDGLATDLSAMIRPKRTGRTLGRAEQRATIIESRGTAYHEDQGVGGSTGIASPLTEQSRVTANREIADPFDPAYVITIAEPTQITFTDANGAEVVMNLEPPS